MRKQKGFTLLELLVVIAIFGIIASVAIPSLTKARELADLRALFGRELRHLSSPLTPAQIWLLRPIALENIAAACGSAKKPEATSSATPDPTDLDAIQAELDRQAGEKPPPPETRPVSDTCRYIQAAAVRQGFLPARLGR